jgi:phage terminase large subunit-like protein
VLQLIADTKAEARSLPPAIVIARIFAVYSIYRCIDTRQEEIIFDGNPHIAQIVAILLLIDAQNGRGAKFGNRLIEVKTGEGKSRVLAGLNCYLALYGYDVYCGCYSSYLSQRD